MLATTSRYEKACLCAGLQVVAEAAALLMSRLKRPDFGCHIVLQDVLRGLATETRAVQTAAATLALAIPDLKTRIAEEARRTNTLAAPGGLPLACFSSSLGVTR